MPPVMGAGAFVMAEITNIPYSTIAVSAILGSVLFYFMVLVSVHFEAKRLKLEGCAPEEIPGGMRSCAMPTCCFRFSCWSGC